ncbi:Hypothetical_protein [Hexamita inflata]|uniref:Hypothetical_protein n=1 Tax=Hexamita inflata TaxID=28002 RepID=A0AA86U0U8_9EUKA|nr:Hypothetical protein HINF_LOCUS4760 [Hexamita inflata]CAI9937510.1 Hypothetical protein HINF_LOCUS25155 [Hexamita inflata]
MKHVQCSEECEPDNSSNGCCKYFENLEWWMLLIGAISVVAFVSIVVSFVLCCCKKRRNQHAQYIKIVEIVNYQKEAYQVKQQYNYELLQSQPIQNPKNVYEIYYNCQYNAN